MGRDIQVIGLEESTPQLYVCNLADEVTDEELRELFCP